MPYSLLAKTCTYGMLHMTVSFFVAWFVTGSLMMALGISFLEPAIQIGAYFCHEKAWHWYGKRHPASAAPDWNISGAGGCPLHDHDHGHDHGHGHGHSHAPPPKDPPKSS